MWTPKDLINSPFETRRNVFRRVGVMVFFDILIAVILFASAGTIAWVYGWFYIITIITSQLVGEFFIPLDVLAERGSKKQNPERWDAVMTGLIMTTFPVLYMVAGLDFRWHWSPNLAAVWHLAGVLIFLLGIGLELWALHHNHFFSTAVRMQFDRGHTVCESGPYRFVRHPGYAGMILYYGISPLFLGTLWAFIPAVMICILFVVRTRLEDKTLHSKLPGYKEYAARVRSRLVPGIW